MKIIGVGYSNYAVNRNITYAQNTNHFLNTYDIGLLISYFNKYIPISDQAGDLKNIFYPKYSFPRKPQLYHLFNGIISGSNTPWLTTFETIVPRHSLLLNEHKENAPNYTKFLGNNHLVKFLKPLSSKNCLGLIAMSECARRIQYDFCSQIKAEGFDYGKLITLLPPQALLNINGNKNIEKKSALHFTFIGKDFFRKGGYEILIAFNELKCETNLPIKLTIVADIRQEWYVNSSEAKIVKSNEIINKNSSWIKHFHHLPNANVLSLLKTTDVGLLPTWSDSFGYSILEMQASGVPVITTDIRAIPEINNDNCGWIIKLEKNIYGELLNYKTDQMNISNNIKTQLKSIISNIIADKSIIRQKAQGAVARIAEYHNPILHAKQLGEIYKNA
ncbi:glycosyltransferase [Pedobacter sp. ASV28]|uniref:glycosyltransferase n=1 Tax=Pedobacter sp. ASV28 TaxID=2795123 RepID=UPI0018ED9089|nr:glycosyltransferase [Pedobacter sp. ASV28]